MSFKMNKNLTLKFNDKDLLLYQYYIKIIDIDRDIPK